MVSTVCLRVLLKVILLSCIQSVLNENVDTETLFLIQSFFHYSYQNENGQYAVAINVPKEQCRSGYDRRVQPFLTNDKSEQVKPKINQNSKDVYKGNEVIAAGHHEDAHSEFLLMNPPNNSPLTHLMEKNTDGCVVFYTLISPCIEKCLNNDIIINGLDALKAYPGIKAFVFTYVNKVEQKNPEILREELKKIADRVPLYRCIKPVCIPCVESGSDKVIDECLTDTF